VIEKITLRAGDNLGAPHVSMGDVCLVDVLADFERHRDDINRLVAEGKVHAIYRMFNGRRAELWRVTPANVANDTMGSPVALISPAALVDLEEIDRLVG
jgi:hypothetical protein